MMPARKRRTAPRLLVALAAAAVIASGAWNAWITRFFMNPDGLSYLDLGTRFWSGDWTAALNAYWSPIYPLLLGLILRILSPSAAAQFPLVHAVNFLIYLFAAGGFGFLLAEVRRARAADHPQPDVIAPALALAAAVVFVHASVLMIGLHQVTPDLLLSAFIYLAAALQLRLRRVDNPARTSLLLGLTLGLGYLVKTIMLPLALPCLAAAALPFRDLRRRLLPAAIAFALLVLPFIAAISLRYRSPTFGESGKYAIAFFVNRSVDSFERWARPLPAGAGQWKHPPRPIWSRPAAFDYGLDAKGTYPSWYDPVRWLDGIETPLDTRALANAVGRNARRLARLALKGPALPVFAAGFVVFLLSPAGWLRRAARFHALWLLALTGVALYAMTLVEPRYVGAFFVLAAIALLAPAAPRHTKPVAAALVIAALASATWLARDALQLRPVTSSPHVEVARLLVQRGLKPGDPVACVGRGFRAYWARLAGLRITADVPLHSSSDFWNFDAADRRGTVAALASTGARVAVANGLPDAAAQEGWQRLGETTFWVLELDPRRSGEARSDNPSRNLQDSPWRHR